MGFVKKLVALAVVKSVVKRQRRKRAAKKAVRTRRAHK